MAKIAEVQEVSLDKLIPYENNPRNNENAVDKVAKSIQEFGFKVPILVDSDCHHYPKMVLNFNEKPILFGSVRTEEGAEITETVSRLMSRRIPTDRTLSDINQRLYNKNSGYTNAIIHDEDVCNTIASSGTYFRYYDGLGLTDADYVHVSTFPEDYKFGKRTPHFLCGMSVPPLLAARIAGEVYKQWLRKK